MADYTLPTNGSSNWGAPLSNAIDAVNAEVEAATEALDDKLNTADAPELIRDTMGATLVGGDNVTITVDDVGNTITIDADGAGGGGSVSAWGDLTGTLSDQTDLQTALDGKSNTGHTHSIANVTSLQTTLDGKAAVSHTHSVADLNVTGTPNGTKFLRDDGSWVAPSPGAAWGTISGSIADQTDLQSELANTPRMVYHDTDADYPRPSTTRPVIWVGAVEPNNRDEALDSWWEAAPTSTFEGALDDYATPFRAYSLRRLLTSYTGPAIRVRRGSDNAEQDIGFTVLGALNTTALSTFADSDSVYVTTWYDQSGSARNLTQATAANQPRIVNAGVIDTSGGLPTIVLDGTNDFLTSSTTGLYAAGATTAAFVMQAANHASASMFSEHGTGTSSVYRMVRASTANWNVQATNNVGTSLWASTASGSNLFDNARHQGFYIDGSGIINTWKDGTQAHNNVTATRSGTFDITAFTIGAHPTGGSPVYVNGNVQEAIFWTSAITTSRTAISAEQKAFWGTP